MGELYEIISILTLPFVSTSVLTKGKSQEENSLLLSQAPKLLCMAVVFLSLFLTLEMAKLLDSLVSCKTTPPKTCAQSLYGHSRIWKSLHMLMKFLVIPIVSFFICVTISYKAALWYTALLTKDGSRQRIESYAKNQRSESTEATETSSAIDINVDDAGKGVVVPQEQSNPITKITRSVIEQLDQGLVAVQNMKIALPDEDRKSKSEGMNQCKTITKPLLRKLDYPSRDSGVNVCGSSSSAESDLKNTLDDRSGPPCVSSQKDVCRLKTASKSFNKHVDCDENLLDTYKGPLTFNTIQAILKLRQAIQGIVDNLVCEEVKELVIEAICPDVAHLVSAQKTDNQKAFQQQAHDITELVNIARTSNVLWNKAVRFQKQIRDEKRDENVGKGLHGGQTQQQMGQERRKP